MSSNSYPSLPGLAYNVSFAPRWSTSIQTAISGRETRIALMQYPMYDIELVYEFLRSSAAYPELQQLVEFFNLAQGSWDSWLWQNPDDYQVTAQSIGTGNGTNTQFQLVRNFGGYVEPVWWPNVTDIKVNGTAVSFTGISAGIVTLSSPPASGAAVTWDGTFSYRCRFSDDSLTMAKFMQQLWENKKVAFTGNLQGRLGTT